MDATQKIIPAWTTHALRANLRRPGFYFYAALLLTTLMLGAGVAWMTLSDGREAKYAHRMVQLLIAGLLVRDTYRLFTFTATGKLGVPVFLGRLILMLAGFEVVMTAVSQSSEEGLGLGFVAAGLPVGLVLLAGGWFTTRLVAPMNASKSDRADRS